MADKEATRKAGGPMVISDAPDVCKTPAGPSMVPVPYPIFALAVEANVVCKKVNFKGAPAMNLDSRIPMVHGDEPGVGGGVKSGVNVSEAKPIDGSSTVHAEGAKVLRHTSKWEMNQGNTTGTMQDPVGTSGSVSPSGAIEGANGPSEPATPVERSWLEKGAQQVGGFFKGAGLALWDMGKGLATLGAGAAKLSPVSQAAEALSQATGIGNYTGYSDTKQAIGDTAKAIYDNPGAVWEGIKQPYAEAWARGDYGEAIGRGVVDVGSFLVPGGGATKGGQAAAAAGKVGEAANVAGKVGKAAEVAEVAGKAGKAAEVAEAAGKAGKAAEAAGKAGKAAEAAEAAGKAGDAAADAGKLAEGAEVSELAKAEKAAVEGEAAAGAGSDGVVVTKKVSLREQYLGKTPGKQSKTGREVIERMKKEGKIRTGPDGNTEFLASDGKWYDLSKADMAHRTDAVTWWNETGRQYGAKSPEVRKWMLDPNNYVLDHYSLNRSAGAKLGQQYLPPLK